MAEEGPGGRAVGLIVNPVAGMGGRVGLKGTDGPATLGRARELGAVPVAQERALRALALLVPLGGTVRVLAWAGRMGEDAARAAGLDPVVVGSAAAGSETTAADTRRAAAAMLARGVDLLLFAGGDGTARDVHAAVGDRVPVLGVPTGVKMHSAVFATGPESAGRLAALHLAGGAGSSVRLRLSEVMDADEGGPRLFGYASVPYERGLLQAAKAGAAPVGDEALALDRTCRRVAAELDPGRLHLVGPGRTTQAVLRHLGLAGTLLGVDTVRDGRLLGADLGEAGILRLLAEADRPVGILLGVVGGQGYLLGRGNQQLSPAVIARAGGRDALTVVASAAKIAALGGRPLLVDTGDHGLDARLAGHVRVRTGPDESMIVRVAPG